MRTTIDFGIDLGTTNSAIAVRRGTDVDVFKNNDRDECTPSAVYMHKGGALYVGKRAKSKLEEEPDNAHAEFKLKMGQNELYTFSRTGQQMKPEDLSAEVLKSLRADVKTEAGEEVDAAVITVPAAFELPQCEATRRAALQAGIVSSPLLQEPVAAALAYGFQSDADKVFWLVFDFGGGTFDAAVIQVRDGDISVVNHEGDNYLGGKLIDWDIVNTLLIPELTRQYRLTDFRKGNPKWKAAIAKLKGKAEDAKIALSRNSVAEIDGDNLCVDDDGNRVDFVYELKRSEVEAIMEPYVARALGLCRKALSAKHLSPGDVERLLLVGGPTVTPYLRERLADPKEGLGIPLEFRIDPLTVVARGAAIFAATQQREKATGPKAESGQYSIDLEYKPVGSDPEPLVGGTVRAPGGADLAGHTIEFVNAEAQPPWRSGRIGLAANGVFMTNLRVDKAKVHTFMIELRNATGAQCDAVPDRLTYTIGLTITDPPLIHSVGIALANNEMEFLLQKGSPLPVRRRAILRTAVDTRRGQSHSISIPVMEGESRRADRNQHIGTLRIESKNMKRDVPAGSEVEVTIEVDASRIVRTKAFIPLLDEEFEHVIDYKEYGQTSQRPEELRADLDQQKERLEKAREKASETGDMKTEELLQRIESEKIVNDVETGLAHGADSEDADKVHKRLLALKRAIDDLDDALEWPALVADTEREIEVERRIMNEANYQATAEEKARFAALEREIRAAMKTRDADLLRHKMGEMDTLGLGIVLRQPGWWIGQLDQLEKKKSTMTDPSAAETYIGQARRAINNDDLEGLKSAVRQLVGLLPAGDTDRDKLGASLIR
ncbi:MAG TPA: Hsp70 family protein [Thermoanaerobaculia bacterium]|nr:Hsp70 family protein [Thermoanaerobaculia bacterium]